MYLFYLRKCFSLFDLFRIELLRSSYHQSYYTTREIVYKEKDADEFLKGLIMAKNAIKTLNKAIVQIKETWNHQLVQKLQQIVDDFENGKIVYKIDQPLVRSTDQE